MICLQEIAELELVPLNQKIIEAGKLKKDKKGDGFECMFLLLLHILLAHGLQRIGFYKACL